MPIQTSSCCSFAHQVVVKEVIGPSLGLVKNQREMEIRSVLKGAVFVSEKEFATGTGSQAFNLNRRFVPFIRTLQS